MTCHVSVCRILSGQLFPEVEVNIGEYLPIFTEPEANNYFSIISEVKIKNVFVCIHAYSRSFNKLILYQLLKSGIFAFLPKTKLSTMSFQTKKIIKFKMSKHSPRNGDSHFLSEVKVWSLLPANRCLDVFR